MSKSNKNFKLSHCEIWNFVPKVKIMENSSCKTYENFLGTLALKFCHFSSGCNTSFINSLDSREVMFKILFFELLQKLCKLRQYLDSISYI